MCSIGPNVRTLVLDVGWSKTVITAVDVSAGLFFPVASKQSAAVSGAVFVQALTDFCAKACVVLYCIDVILYLQLAVNLCPINLYISNGALLLV